MCSAFLLSHKRLVALVFAVCCGVVAQSAAAITLTFDELDPMYYESEEAESPYLTDEYESVGLLFDGAAYLHKRTALQPSVSSPNYVVGPGFVLNFIGDFPTYVSMYVGSTASTAVFLTASGPGGYQENKRTDGEVRSSGYEESTPYVPNQFIFFSSPTGISSIELSTQGDSFIDNLTFTSDPDIEVPESSTFILFAIGLLGLILCKRRELE
jgi:hypothetical protein